MEKVTILCHEAGGQATDKYPEIMRHLAKETLKLAYISIVV